MGIAISRRKLLVGGGAGVGLVLAWGLWPRSYRPNLVASPGEHVANAFLKIGEDGRIVVIVPQAEMGQGVWTALPQILADELGADWRTVAVEPAPINPLYANDFLLTEAAGEALPSFLAGAGRWAARELAVRSAFMLTGGSTSIRGFEQRFAEAGAAARAMLCMAAGKRWNADWRALDTADGFVIRGEEKLRFAELAADAASMEPPADVPLRGPRPGGLTGQSLQRLDLPAKVDGSIRYAGDVRLPDMLYASVRGGPVGGGATLETAVSDNADAVAGVTAVIRTPGWVAVVATNWWAANRALDQIEPSFATSGPRADDAAVEKALLDALDAEGGRFASEGDLGAVFRGATVIRADYAVPFAPHAAIEPLVATARIQSDRAEIWAPTQAPGIMRDAVARALDLPLAAVTIYAMPIGGGFGRKVDVDAAVQAALIARRVRRPIQLMWSRAEELQQGRHRPPARARMAARLGPDGAILGWQAKIATPSTGAELAGRWFPSLPSDPSAAESAAVDGARPPYAIAALAIDHHPAVLGIPTGMWRAVAHSYTAFFTESFVDELARQAGIDPFGYRMRMLGGQPRLAHCLATATALGGWEGGVAGSGQGIACHSSFGSHVALLADVRVTKEQTIRVDKVTAVVDCGRIINPGLVRQQIEGGIIWGMAAALGGAIGYRDGLVDGFNFDRLALPRLAESPEIRVELVRSNAAPGGVGEIAVSPVAPAIVNALVTLGGRRLRTLPLAIGGA